MDPERRQWNDKINIDRIAADLCDRLLSNKMATWMTGNRGWDSVMIKEATAC